MRTIRIVLEGIEDGAGNLVVGDGTLIPASLRTYAVEETVTEETLQVGEYVSNSGYSRIAMVVDAGYLMMLDMENPENVGKIFPRDTLTLDGMSQIPRRIALGRITAMENAANRPPQG